MPVNMSALHLYLCSHDFTVIKHTPRSVTYRYDYGGKETELRVYTKNPSSRDDAMKAARAILQERP